MLSSADYVRLGNRVHGPEDPLLPFRPSAINAADDIAASTLPFQRIHILTSPTSSASVATPISSFTLPSHSE